MTTAHGSACCPAPGGWFVFFRPPPLAEWGAALKHCNTGHTPQKRDISYARLWCSHNFQLPRQQA